MVKHKLLKLVQEYMNYYGLTPEQAAKAIRADLKPIQIELERAAARR